MNIDSAARLTPLAVALCFGVLGSARAGNTYVAAVVYPTLFHCEPSGDDGCVNGQVDPSDPALAADNHNSWPNVAPDILIGASKSYIDPRLGTANNTSGQALAGFGVLRASASAAVSSIPPLNSRFPNLMRLGTTASAGFWDNITIMPSDPALMGKAGTFSASFVVHGSLDAAEVNGRPSIYLSSMGYASWELSISTGVTSVKEGGYKYVDFGWGGLGPEAVVNISGPFVFGTPFALSGYLEVKGFATIGAAVAQPYTQGITAATGASSYMNTARWNGIQSVKSGGQTVTAFTVASSSGTDYAKEAAELRLTITRAGSDLMISWPNAFAGYTLESTAALNSGTWLPVGSPVNTNGTFQVTVTPSEATQYYRLQHP